MGARENGRGRGRRRRGEGALPSRVSFLRARVFLRPLLPTPSTQAIDHPSQVSICLFTLPKLSVDMNVKSPNEKSGALILTICYLHVK